MKRNDASILKCICRYNPVHPKGKQTMIYSRKPETVCPLQISCTSHNYPFFSPTDPCPAGSSGDLSSNESVIIESTSLHLFALNLYIHCQYPSSHRLIYLLYYIIRIFFFNKTYGHRKVNIPYYVFHLLQQIQLISRLFVVIYSYG